MTITEIEPEINNKNVASEERKKAFHKKASPRKKITPTEISDTASREEIEESVVEELNKKHAVVHTDQFYILTEKHDPVMGGVNFSLESKQSFLNTYENQIVYLPKGKPKNKAQIWIKHQKRRQFEGIIFHPQPKEIEGNYYNIFRGFSVEPKKGSCEKYKEHTRTVICSNNSEPKYNCGFRFILRLLY